MSIDPEIVRLTVEKILEHYIVCALWSSTDESRPDGGDPLDRKYSRSNIADEAISRMRADCERFYAENAAIIDESGATAEQVGHDFWLSRNGHGAGFFDREEREYGPKYEEVCKKLQEAAQRFGAQDLYVGDDGKLYV